MRCLLKLWEKISENHFFAKTDINLNFEEFDESNLTINVQRVSNDTYLRVHDISSNLMTSKTIMKSSAELNLLKNEFSKSFNFLLRIAKLAIAGR